MKIRTNLSLSTEEVEMANKRAGEVGLSRSQYIGQLIRRDAENVSIQKIGKLDPYWETDEGVQEILDRR
jgi:hypothetical protein